MATYSNYLGLKLNAPTDPFQLSDFVANWGVLDASPGIFICTSASRPSWVASQAGRMIFMTDLKQHSWWDGANWNDLRDAAPVFTARVDLENSMASGSSPTFGICTFTTPRPCALTIWVTGTYAIGGNQVQGVAQFITLDGARVSGSGYWDRSLLQGSTYDTGYDTVPSMCVVASINSGSHTIGVSPSVQTLNSSAITIKGAAAIGMISLFNTSNNL